MRFDILSKHSRQKNLSNTLFGSCASILQTVLTDRRPIFPKRPISCLQRRGERKTWKQEHATGKTAWPDLHRGEENDRLQSFPRIRDEYNLMVIDDFTVDVSALIRIKRINITKVLDGAVKVKTSRDKLQECASSARTSPAPRHG